MPSRIFCLTVPCVVKWGLWLGRIKDYSVPDNNFCKLVHIMSWFGGDKSSLVKSVKIFSRRVRNIVGKRRKCWLQWEKEKMLVTVGKGENAGYSGKRRRCWLQWEKEMMLVTVGKGEDAAYKHFHNFPQRFLSHYLLGALIIWIICTESETRRFQICHLLTGCR